MAATTTLIGIAVAVAPAARADDVEGYLQLLRDRGIYATSGDSALVRAGLWVCDELDRGRSPMSVAREVYASTDVSIDAEDAGAIVGAAIAGLCDEHLPRVYR